MSNQQKPFPELKHGVPDFLAQWAKDVKEWCEQNRPLEGPGIAITDEGKGKLITATGLTSAGIAAALGPWQVTQAPTPTGESGVYYMVSLNSWLCGYTSAGQASLANTSKITVTGLGAPKALSGNTTPWYIWLDINTSPLFSSPGHPAVPTATIKDGAKWDLAGQAVFPNRFYWNTDNGTPTGSTMTAPPNTYQNRLVVPLMRIVAPKTDPLGVADKFGIHFSKTQVGVQLMPLTHLLLGNSCYSSTVAIDFQPWIAAQQIDP